MLVEKENFTIYGGIPPIEEDNSMWITVIYEMWGIVEINNDLSNRINMLELTPLNKVDNSIINIKEGMRILSYRLEINPYFRGFMATLIYNNLDIMLKFREITIAKKRKEIDEKKDHLIERMEKFRQDLESRQVKAEHIDKEKKEITKETSYIRKMGADNDCLRQIGRVMKIVYSQISKFVEML